METSILKTIKEMLGIGSDDTSFDSELIVYINSYLVRLMQLGYGSSTFQITGYDETWKDLLNGDADLMTIKPWLFAKVRMAFDPPSSGNAQEALKELINEMEFAFRVALDNPTTDNLLHPSVNT